MTKPSTHLRFLLALGNTKIVVLKQEEDLHVYSNQKTSGTEKNPVQAEHISEALVAK